MQKKYRDWFTPFTWYTIKFIWLLVKNVLYIINRLQRVINWYIHMRTCCGKISCFRVSVFWFEARGWSPYWLCLVRTGGHLCRSLQASSTSLSNIHLILFPRELPQEIMKRPLNDSIFDVAGDKKTKADRKCNQSTICCRNVSLCKHFNLYVGRKTLWLRLIVFLWPRTSVDSGGLNNMDGPNCFFNQLSTIGNSQWTVVP